MLVYEKTPPIKISTKIAAIGPLNRSKIFSILFYNFYKSAVFQTIGTLANYKIAFV